jgi:hypothetical protein
MDLIETVESSFAFIVAAVLPFMTVLDVSVIVSILPCSAYGKHSRGVPSLPVLHYQTT